MSDIRKILESPTLRRDIHCDVRIVLRRSRLSTREISDACLRRMLTLSRPERCCDLVANGSVIAKGKLVEREGVILFEGEKQ